MPLSLSDDEYAAVLQAAAPIHPMQRDDFLQALAGELERHPVIGAGVVHRCAADLQRRYVVEARKEAEIAGAPRHLTPRQAAR
jgi:hypothetical protein